MSHKGVILPLFVSRMEFPNSTPNVLNYVHPGPCPVDDISVTDKTRVESETHHTLSHTDVPTHHFLLRPSL